MYCSEKEEQRWSDYSEKNSWNKDLYLSEKARDGTNWDRRTMICRHGEWPWNKRELSDTDYSMRKLMKHLRCLYPWQVRQTMRPSPPHDMHLSNQTSHQQQRLQHCNELSEIFHGVNQTKRSCSVLHSFSLRHCLWKMSKNVQSVSLKNFASGCVNGWSFLDFPSSRAVPLGCYCNYECQV